MEPWARALGFGWRVAYSHAERLALAGLAERVYDRRGSVLAITRAGRRLLAAPPGESDGFGWPQRDGLKWPHLALVDVSVG